MTTHYTSQVHPNRFVAREYDPAEGDRPWTPDPLEEEKQRIREGTDRPRCPTCGEKTQDCPDCDPNNTDMLIDEAELLSNIVHTGLAACDLCPAPALTEYGEGQLCKDHYEAALEVERGEVELRPTSCPACGGEHPVQQCEQVLSELHKPIASPPRTDITFVEDIYAVIVRGRVVAHCPTHTESTQARDAVLYGSEADGNVVHKVCRCEGVSGDGIHECAAFQSWVVFHNGMMLEQVSSTKEAAEQLLVAFVGRVGPRAWTAKEAA